MKIFYEKAPLKTYRLKDITRGEVFRNSGAAGTYIRCTNGYVDLATGQLWPETDFDGGSVYILLSATLNCKDA